MNNKSYIREQLQLAIAAYKAGEFVRCCEAWEAVEVIARMKAQFITDERRRWWWEAFKKPLRKVGSAPDGKGLEYLADYVEPATDCWLIIDDDSSDLPVIQTTVAGTQYLLSELPSVEYYLAGIHFDWLLAENHHGKIWFL